MIWKNLQPGLHSLLKTGMRFKAEKDYVSTNYGSAVVQVPFLGGITYELRYLSPHNGCPEGEAPTEENTMAVWVLGGSRAVEGLKQSSRQILEAVLDGRLVPQP